MLNQWGIFSCKLVISGDQEISDQAKSTWGDTGSRELTISAKSAEQDPTKNLFHIATQRLSQQALDWNLFHWQENLWNYYFNQKEKGLNTGFFVHEKIFRRIEFHLKTKCLVSSHSYTLVSRMYNESKKAFSWHKIFNFYEPNSVQVALKIPYQIFKKTYPMKTSFFFHYIFLQHEKSINQL